MPANKEKEALLDAVIDGNEGRLAAVLHQAVLLSDYINENIVDGKQTALMVAARHGRLSNVRLLVEKGGADLNAVSPSGLTALMVGCWKGHFEVVDFLLKRGADPQKTCLQGLHALIYASKYGHLRCVERLLLLGGKNVCIDKQDSARMSAYAHACLEDHPEVARALVLMGAADYSVDPHILERILARGNRECVAISEVRMSMPWPCSLVDVL
jgi:ankyrin repeat protein